MNAQLDDSAPEEKLLEINVRWRKVSAWLLKVTSDFLEVVTGYVNLFIDLHTPHLVWFQSAIPTTGRESS